mmetsp:Transcript_71667/g.203342  ORF Transcript_71667/g.203342 Transcript_71667/m.203342 type:complete len:298 (-) Transcript_71667:395-1288(-)
MMPSRSGRRAGTSICGRRTAHSRPTWCRSHADVQDGWRESQSSPYLQPHFPASISSFPFWRNWNTAVAASTLPGFLSGCHSRKSARNSFMRASLGSTSRSFISFASASAFAFSTSGLLDAAAPSFGALANPPPSAEAAWILPTEELQLVAEERLRAEPLALRLLLFLPLLLDLERLRERLLLFFFFPLLLELLSEEEELFRRRGFRLRERLTLLTLPPPFLFSKSISRIAREPACGDRVRLGAAGTAADPSASGRGRCALHLTHSKRFMKLRSEQFSQYQSRLLSSSPNLPAPVWPM